MDPSIDERRRTRFVGFGTSLAFHALIAAVALWPVRYALQPIEIPTTRDGPVIFLVDSLPAAAEVPALPGLNPPDSTQDDERLKFRGESSVVSLPGFEFDFSKIADRAPLLFPFVTPGLSLDRFALAAKPAQHLQLPESLLRSAAGDGGSKPPLTLDPAAVQSLVDKSWSRRDRWGVFEPVASLAEKYDPEAGELPRVFREYSEQNGLQPYTDPGSRDPRLWTELGLAADHVEFIGFISQYASTHPSTRGAIELLFLLDKLSLASRDALVTLLDADPVTDLRWTQRANPEAFSFIEQAQRHYNTVLEKKKILSRSELGLHYDSVRLGILNGILQTTPEGYRAGDARFLIGAIYWRQGRKTEAVATWRGIRIDPRDCYAIANRDIVEALRRADAQGGVSEREIERILAADNGRWISTSIDRLRKFGYRLHEY